ncbi:glycosyltransferase [Xanthocytophaga flava]|uniref:glycosyltransferase n=1 Tax=Xanthocytophaga flava TaxID=3048013 RepID=UPI0028D049BB|nr:glycosyltransferase [Xanthocytophaga flavus]MDJ1472127.1 glycosyltransferase [Xanthocytophaga flavus]
MLFHGAYILHENPRIVSLWDDVALQKITSQQKKHDTYFLLHLPWNHGNFQKMLRKKLFFSQLSGKGFLPVMFTNSKKEESYRKLFRIPGLQCSAYIYTDEKDYGILSVDKKYDAVYAAQLMPFKRIELAKELNKVFVLTYTPGAGKSGENDLPSFCPAMKHADYNKTWVDHIGKNRLFNQSQVGLCLSKEEGPMLASLEYMLSGLPVVSTESEGGRDEYYDKEYCLIVNDNPTAIRKGVEEMVARQIDPNYIREKTIAKLNQDRQRYVEFISDYVRKNSHVILDPSELIHQIFDKPKNSFIPVDKL